MENKGVYLAAPKDKLEVKASTFPKPAADEVLIRNYAAAVNPIDVRMQDTGKMIQQYPHILGCEIAGEVEEVGEDVQGFKKGDRVAAIATATRTGNLTQAGFQLFTSVPAYVVSHIPDSLPYANAVVLPIGLSTAIAALYDTGHLNLPAPSLAKTEKDKIEDKKAILIWGGSTSVGSCAIQLAAVSGITVITTASPKNHQYVRDLGASHVIDYSDAKVVERLIDSASGFSIVGAIDTISSKDTNDKCAEFLHHFGGGVLMASTNHEAVEPVMLGDVQRNLIHVASPSAEKGYPIWMGIWNEFMTKGLETGALLAKPDPIIVKGGLEKVQEALDLYRKGISAAKIVVEL